MNDELDRTLPGQDLLLPIVQELMRNSQLQRQSQLSPRKLYRL